jgi:hypothetical protein
MRCASLFGILLTLLACYAAETRVASKGRSDEASAEAKSASRVEEALYDPDPKHPWNRLHRFLHSRTMPDGKVYDQEDLEPPLLPSSKFLTEGPSYREAMALLDTFLKERAAARIDDPLKRAILQRDLWAVFTTLSGAARKTYRERPPLRSELVGMEDPGDTELPQRSQRREVQARLAQIMRQVALAPAEIDALPDNLAAAMRAGTFPTSFDPKHPDRPFLPPDLLDPDGPWVAVANPDRMDGLAAPEHVRFTKGRALFSTLVRSPEGRKSTEASVKKLEFPTGTQVALLRRMLLIDTTGTIRPTHVTESLQLRVFQEPRRNHPAFECILRRADLIAQRHGGLRPVGAEEVLYFNFGGLAGDQAGFPDPVEERSHRHPDALRKTCMVCHVDVNDTIRLSTAFAGGREIPVFHQGPHDESKQIVGWSVKPGLMLTTLKQQVESTIAWTRKTYTWGLLQGLWEAEPRR